MSADWDFSEVFFVIFAASKSKAALRCWLCFAVSPFVELVCREHTQKRRQLPSRPGLRDKRVDYKSTFKIGLTDSVLRAVGDCRGTSGQFLGQGAHRSGGQGLDHSPVTLSSPSTICKQASLPSFIHVADHKFPHVDQPYQREETQARC